MASKEWVRFNEDAKAKQHRTVHVEKYGGEFVYRGNSRGWHWVNGTSTPKPEVASFSKKKKTTTKQK